MGVALARLRRRRARKRAMGPGPWAPSWDDVDRLHASQAIESQVLLFAAEHYANVVERVPGEEEGRMVCHAVGLGFALRTVEEAAGRAAPVPDGFAPPSFADPAGEISEEAARLSAAHGVRLEDEPGVLTELFAPGFEAWRQLSERCRRTAASASLRRRRTFLELSGRDFRGLAPALVDYERAFRFGYLVACLEAVSVRPLPRAGGPEDILERVDDLLTRGAGLYAVRDTEVALVVGVVHGSGLESASQGDKDAAISAARAGFALRVAEEEGGFVERKLPELTDSLALAEARNPLLLHWDAAQALAWELVERDEDLSPPADHAAAMTRILGALDGGDPGLVDRACRFGYALRCAEASLPHDPSRRLRDD